MIFKAFRRNECINQGVFSLGCFPILINWEIFLSGLISRKNAGGFRPLMVQASASSLFAFSLFLKLELLIPPARIFTNTPGWYINFF